MERGLDGLRHQFFHRGHLKGGRTGACHRSFGSDIRAGLGDGDRRRRGRRDIEFFQLLRRGASLDDPSGPGIDREDGGR